MFSSAASFQPHPQEQKLSLPQTRREGGVRSSNYLREYMLVIEYKHLGRHCPSGVYVLPSDEDPHVWHAVIFIREGLYKGGCFKFQINLPPNYPERGPTVRFSSRMFHPLISPKTGEVSIARFFPKWRPYVDHAWDVLAAIKRLFYSIDPANPLNPIAADMYLNDKPSFEREAKECVANSTRNVYVQPESCPIKFSEYREDLHDPIRRQMLGEEVDANDDNDDILSNVGKAFASFLTYQ